MGAIKPDSNKALAALTSAALSLPGLNASAAIPAQQIHTNVSYGHYQESDERMRVEVYHADAVIPLSDRIELSFSLDRDTYSGATPAYSIPAAITNQAKYVLGGGRDLVEYVDLVSSASGGVTASGLTVLGGLNSFKSYVDGMDAAQDNIDAASQIANSGYSAQYEAVKTPIDEAYQASLNALSTQLSAEKASEDAKAALEISPLTQDLNADLLALDIQLAADKALQSSAYNASLGAIDAELPALLENYNVSVNTLQSNTQSQRNALQSTYDSSVTTLNTTRTQAENDYIANTLGSRPSDPISITATRTIDFNNVSGAAYYGMANVNPTASGVCRLNQGSQCVYPFGTSSPTLNNFAVGIVEDPTASGAHLHYGNGQLTYHNDSSGVYLRAQTGAAFSLDSMDFLAPISNSNPGTGAEDYWEILGFNQSINPDLYNGDGTNYATKIAYQTVANGFNGTLTLNSSFANVNAVWLHYKGYPKTPTDPDQVFDEEGVEISNGPLQIKSFSVTLDNIVVSPVSTPTSMQTAWDNTLQLYRTTYSNTVYNPSYTTLTTNYNSQLSALNASEQSELTRLGNEYTAARTDLIAEHQAEIAALDSNYQAQLAQLDSANLSARQQATASYNAATQAINDKYAANKNALTAQYNSNVATVTDNYNLQTQPLTDTYNQQISQQTALDAELSKQAQIAQYAAILNKLVPTGNATVQRFQLQPQETRSMPQFGTRYYFDNTTLGVTGGFSEEPDFLSNFGNVDISHEFNNKLTTVSAGYGMTSNTINRSSDSHAGHAGHSEHFGAADYPRLNEESKFHNFTASISQVFSKNSVAQLSTSFTHQTGYLSNPYKFVYVRGEISPEEYYQLATDAEHVDWKRITQLEVVGTELFRENRPSQRNQWSLSSRLNQHVPALDASLHLDYRFYLDDWGINSHTFELKWYQSLPWGLTVTPGIRYYSQSQADFFAPYFLSPRADGFYTSDFRLSAFGDLSGGLTIGKQFARGVKLEGGFEYVTHAGSLKLGGGGIGDYADFDYFMAHANLSVDFAAKGLFEEGSSHESHHHHHVHGAPPPAGIMFGHMMNQADSIMVGYRFMYNVQSGAMLRGNSPASDAAIVAGGCSGFSNGCIYKPTKMHMQMHMLDLMYAPTDWLNLMVMPQLMSMDMSMSNPIRAFADQEELSEYGGHGGAYHTSNDIGDTVVTALIKLADDGKHHLHAGIGVSAPTGSIDAQMSQGSLKNNAKTDVTPGSPVLQDYGMQLGSGTWDFKPSLTYVGGMDDWGWGMQLSGIKRLEKNKYGYAYGDLFQASGWGSYRIFDWLSASIRGVYTWQDKIQGSTTQNHEPTAPVDYPTNYGGRYWDIGFGLNAYVPDGRFAGHSFGVEWLQPVGTDHQGYQLDRDGALTATWNYAF
ncbi:DUF3570 domain-containing protein [Methylococcaceae bacterium WWC4]|nr:DUF3570 domain-containing protein [Methylococcaceae bacterium WWC4]